MNIEIDCEQTRYNSDLIMSTNKITEIRMLTIFFGIYVDSATASK